MRPYTLPFSSLGRHDVAEVGGKNSSLGEMISNLAQLGVSVPDGFATTADAYRITDIQPEGREHGGDRGLSHLDEGAGDQERAAWQKAVPLLIEAAEKEGALVFWSRVAKGIQPVGHGGQGRTAGGRARRRCG